MHVDVVPRRDDTTCHGKAYFWACHSGKFRGCCTEDPCTLGYCPDDDKTSTTSKSTTSTSSIRARRSTSTDSSTDEDGGVFIRTETATETETQTKTARLHSFIMTDSGTTHTIPSNDRVTITKHTLIVTDKAPSRTPTPEASSSSSSTWISTHVLSSGSMTVVAAETSSATASLEDNTVGGFSTGAIVGAAVGGLIALAIIAVLMIVLRRRRRRTRRNSQETMSRTRESESGEKAYFEAMSPHTTGTQGSGGDPFAPFGGQRHFLFRSTLVFHGANTVAGRADKTDDIHQPPVNTFEMDGTSSAPVELPTEIHGASDSHFSNPRSSNTSPGKYRVQPSGPVDPRANLNASTADRRHNTYVNHWNQYRDLGPAR
ncbi:hypothetical protein EDB81DRAFT_194199 [Dactylonectria macrodidyma]|uniref:receptor protein-tyrosine kinase n=1 Tax=Dactylonectria macrodidyma TaxID=307937 RepID=A0A9P9FT15_9HYPO|nr:hypothetical protein EDB81DRAFT_194199 [Dactylonectria macrodidyma]